MLGGVAGAAAKPPSAASAAASSYTGRVLVTLRAPARGRAHASAVGAFIVRTGARPDGPSAPAIDMITVAPPAGVGLTAFLRELRRQPGVSAAAPERRFTLRDVPNDPALHAFETAPGTPPGTLLQWWAVRENLPQAWDISHGVGARVAIIDSGIDGSHPELSGKIAYTNVLDSNPGDVPATTDLVGHGTHVAGLACAAANNGVGIVGAGYDCQLLIEKSDLTESSVIAAIIDATQHHAGAINMSFGTDGSSAAPPQLYDAVNYAHQHNVVLVSAAADSPVQEQGDPSNVLQPAGTGSDITKGEGLSVTAANFSGQRASFAGFGSEVSIAAFGSFYDAASQGGPAGIFSTFPGNSTQIEQGSLFPLSPARPCTDCRTSFEGDNRYAYLMGTSMAAPQVAAVAAMIRQLNPSLSAADVITLLKQTAQRRAGSGWSSDLGWGILDAGAALAAARTIDRIPPVSHLSASRHVSGRAVTLTWTGYDPAPPGLIASGIDHYEIFQTNGGRGAGTRIATVPASQTSLRVRVTPSRLYGWYSVAVDKAGNREPKSSADVRTRVSSAGGSSRSVPRARKRSTPRKRRPPPRVTAPGPAARSATPG